MSTAIPCQYTLSFARSRHLSRSWCPACRAVRIYWCIAAGIITCVPPFSTMPSSTASSSLKDQKGLNMFGTSLCFSGHPLMVMPLNGARIGSLAVSCLNFWMRSWLNCTKFTLTSNSTAGSYLSLISLDSPSADSKVLPGQYLIVTS